MSHCFPCSGSGWYVSSSYVSASVEYPFLSGPFETFDVAKAVIDDIISTQRYEYLTFANVFEHLTSREVDAWHFFDLLSNDAWDDQRADVFEELVNDSSGQTIVGLLSGAWDARQQLTVVDPCDFTACKALQLQRTGGISDALAIMESLFGPRTV